jgi:hypothetical protein
LRRCFKFFTFIFFFFPFYVSAFIDVKDIFSIRLYKKPKEIRFLDSSLTKFDVSVKKLPYDNKILLLVDVSNSIKKEWLLLFKINFIKFLENHSFDEYILYTFGGKLNKIITSYDKKEFLKKLTDIKLVDEKTCLYDAIYSLRDYFGRVVFVIFTDGEDEDSTISSEKLYVDASGFNFIIPKEKKDKALDKGIRLLSRIYYLEEPSKWDIKPLAIYLLNVRYSVPIWYYVYYKHRVSLLVDGKKYIKDVLLYPVWLFFGGVGGISLLFVFFIYFVYRRQKQKKKDVVSINRIYSNLSDNKKVSSESKIDEGEYIYKRLYPVNKEKAKEVDYRKLIRRVLPKHHWGMLIDIDVQQNYLLQKEETTIGSSPEDDIYIPIKVVEPSHAIIKFIKEQFVLFDKGTFLGTYLNGKKLLRPKPLKENDEIMIAGKRFVFTKYKS